MLDAVHSGEASAQPAPQDAEPDAFLAAVRDGRPLTDALLISCHAHLGRGLNHPMYGPDADTMVTTMDRLGIDISCVSSSRALGPDLVGGNAEIQSIVAVHPTRFVGTVVFNPHFPSESIRDLERYFSQPGFGMVKVHPEFHSYPLDGPGYDSVWRLAAERRIPVLTHAWGFGQGYDHPDQAAKVADQNPQVRLILGHSGGTPEGLRTSVEVAIRHEHVYLDTGTSLVYRGAIEFLVHGAGAGRVLFGTDASYLADAPQVSRIAGSRLSTVEKEQIFGLNLQSLLTDADVDLPGMRNA